MFAKEYNCTILFINLFKQAKYPAGYPVRYPALLDIRYPAFQLAGYPAGWISGINSIRCIPTFDISTTMNVHSYLPDGVRKHGGGGGVVRPPQGGRVGRHQLK
jgi:hypothetical protein